MGFTDADRTIQTQTATDVAWIKDEHGRRLEELEKEDDKLHSRITEGRQETDKRINGIKLFSTGAVFVGSAAGSFLAFLKTLKGG